MAKRDYRELTDMWPEAKRRAFSAEYVNKPYMNGGYNPTTAREYYEMLEDSSTFGDEEYSKLRKLAAMEYAGTPQVQNASKGTYAQAAREIYVDELAKMLGVSGAPSRYMEKK